MSSKNDAPIISDPALNVHRNWCEPDKCRVDHDDVEDVDLVTHNSARYGFVTEPDNNTQSPERLTVQVQEFNNGLGDESLTVLLEGASTDLELGLYDLQRLRYLLGMAEDDLIAAMDEQEAREDAGGRDA